MKTKYIVRLFCSSILKKFHGHNSNLRAPYVSKYVGLAGLRPAICYLYQYYKKPVIIIRGFYGFSVVSSASLSLFTNLQSQIESSINIILIFAPTIILYYKLFQETDQMTKKLPQHFKLKHLITKLNHFGHGWDYSKTCLKTAHTTFIPFQTEFTKTNFILRFQVISALTCAA